VRSLYKPTIRLACTVFLLLGSCADPAPIEEPAQADVPSAIGATVVGPEADNELKPADTPEFLPEDFEILTVEPAQGVTTGGSEVIVTGRGFVPDMVILFDQSPALELFLIHEQMAIMRVPPHPPGRVDVWMYHEDIDWGAPRILEDAFLYFAEVEIAEVTPNRGSVQGGEQVTILGTGFDSSSKFFVDGHLAIDQVVVDENTMTGFTPPGDPGDAHVHVVNLSGTFESKNAFAYGLPPALSDVSPLWAPAAGGTKVRLTGVGLSSDVAVFFGDEEAVILERSKDQSWVDVIAPAGPPGMTSDITVVTWWGLSVAEDAFFWEDTDADPYLLQCATFFPAHGPTEGNSLVTFAGAGFQYETTLTFNGVEALVIEKNADAQKIQVLTPPGEDGTATVVMSTPYGAVTCAQSFVYEAPPSFEVVSVSPAAGAVDGGDSIVVLGSGFADNPSLYVGAMPATAVERISESQINAVTPPGTPGHADIRVIQSGDTVILPHGFEYQGDDLSLDLVSPSMIARAGGTYLRVTGTAFSPDAKVTIGGEEAKLIEFVSSSEIHVRSPKLEVGTYAARIDSNLGTSILEAAITAFDPQSGYSGTWGGPIDETLNVTVRGTNKYGPVSGAFVLIESNTESRFGYTDENGQITFSEPGLYGPVSATATHPEFDAYSVFEYDATNITIYLRPKKLGSGTPPPTWPDATLSGEVLGLGKYVIPPPGSCESMAIEDTEHCKSCDEAAPCDAPEFACQDIGPEGSFCLASCVAPADCPDGYVCAPAMGGTRCLPAPGQKIAKCMVSNSSPFGLEPAVPPEGAWVTPGGSYELLSGRLGDIAVVCFGGYMDLDEQFTPTVMGVRRHVFAEPAAIMTGLDVSLNIPLKKTMRLRIMDPPSWPGGLHDPAITLSLDLGSDGAIPMSRSLISAGSDTWLAPRQVGKLQGAIYDATYFFYSRIQATTPTKLPSSYSLISGVDQASETRLPIFKDGAWSLELSPIEDDLHGIWGPSSEQLYVVGDKGTILLFSGNAWTAQSSGTDSDLRAIDGRHGSDVWAVGEKGTMLHFAGGGWLPVDAPMDNYRDVATEPGQPLYAVGETRIRRFEDGVWTVEGPPWVQGIESIDLLPNGSMAAVGTGGRLFVRSGDGNWSLVDTPTSANLRDVILLGDEVIAVGDGGTVLTHTPEAGAGIVSVDTDRTLFAVTANESGEVIVVGDDGVVLHRIAGLWGEEVINDYRSTAYDIFAPKDGGPVRVVGSTAFIIGPFVHFPYVTAPVHDGNLDSPKMAWTWDGGPDNQVTRLLVYENTGKLLWTFVVNGEDTEFVLPDLKLLMGYAPLPAGKKRLEISRILNTNFDIDNYTSREWNLYRRDSWASNRSYFMMD
jgi:hypothetical protein